MTPAQAKLLTGLVRQMRDDLRVIRGLLGKLVYK